MRDIKTKLKNSYTVAAFGLLNGVLLLLLLNLVLYTIMLARRLVRPWALPAPIHLLDANPGWREEDVKELLRETDGLRYQYEPFTGFKVKPFRGRFVNVDPAGFRISKNQAPWPPNPKATNVFVFGGSTGFGWGLPDDETVASHLQEFATADHSPPRLAIYNFAVPGYFSTQELILFQQLLNAGFVPQVAVFVDGSNEFIYLGVPKFTEMLAYFMDGKSEPKILTSLPMMQAAHWVREQWSSSKQPRQNLVNLNDPARLQGVVDRWLANKRTIELVASGHGVRTMFVWEPSPVYKYDLRYHLSVHSVKEFWTVERRVGLGYPLMENLWAQGKLGSNVLWLADMQQDKHENLYVDGTHYNAAFSKEIAAQIYAFLRQPPKVR